MKIAFSAGKFLLMTFLGWLAGIVLAIIFLNFLEKFGLEPSFFILGFAIALGVNYFQWLHLRTFLVKSFNWCLLGVIGMSLPFLLMDFLPDSFIENKMLIGTILGSLLYPSLQYLLLRKRFTKSILWIPFTFLGWFASLGLLLIIDISLDLKVSGSKWIFLFIFNVLFILGGGVIVGAIQGIALKWLRKIIPTEKQSTF